MSKQPNMSALQVARDLIRGRIEELQNEQRQLELRYAQNSRVIAELENLLQRLNPPSPSSAAAEQPETEAA